MKRVNTFLCCLMLTVYGAFVGINNRNSQNEVTAATVNLNDVPYDLRPVRTLTDTVSVHDTIYIPKVVTKYHVKHVKVPYRDTIDITIHFVYTGATKKNCEPDSLPRKL